MKKDVMLYIIFIVLLIIAILLFGIRKEVINHYEAFDKNPLLYGADKYELDYCTCWKGLGSFNFNKTTITSNTAFRNMNENINTSIFDNLMK